MNASDGINGKTVIVTGGGGGIGEKVAYDFASLGAKVAVVDIDGNKATAAAERITAAGGTARAYVCDATDYSGVEETVSCIAGDFGKIHILINLCGGSARKKRKLYYEQDISVFRNIIEINLYAAYFFARAATKYMIEQGEGGRIINTSSVVGMNGHFKHAEYSAAKGAIIAITKSMAKEVGRFGITVNTVSPGMIPTPAATGGDLSHTNYLKKTPSASDVSAAMVYLAGESAGFVTGLNLIVDGGRSLATRGTEPEL